MIGNDVVDLILARKESNWKRKGFLNKLFTASEQKLIFNATNQEEMVWMLWSIKESVYKAYQRINYNEGFYPTKIEIISFNSKKESVTKLFDTCFYGETTVHNEIIATVVLQHKNDFTKITYSNSKLYTKNANNLPEVKLSNKPISISHHGRHTEIVELS
jgi:phosphopantetheinyl transferase (holo-ACP synthase)